MSKLNEECQIIDGPLVAKYYKYYLQQKNPYVVYKLPVNKVSIKGFYNKYKSEFDKLAKIFNKYNLDIIMYLEYFVLTTNHFEKDIKTELVTNLSITKYADYLQIRRSREKIYKYFLRSANNIAKECIRLNYVNVIDYLRYLIKNRLLANYCLAGKISIYYLAAIPKFNKVILQLDDISKDEFNTLYERFDKYHTDVNEAFLQMKNIKINPIRYTNDLILKLRNV